MESNIYVREAKMIKSGGIGINEETRTTLDVKDFTKELHLVEFLR